MNTKSAFIGLLLLLCVINIDLSANTNQGNYRWRNDDGSESAATWRQNQNTNDTLSGNNNIRLRVELYNTDATNPNFGLVVALFYSADNSTYTQVTTDGSLNHWKLNASDNFSDGDATTNQLSTSYAFAAGNIYESSTTFSASIGASSSEEYEFCISPTQNTASGTTYYFKILNSAGGNIDGYGTIPTVYYSGIANVGNATEVTASSAIIHGTVNPEGLNTTAYILYGTTPGVYDSLAADQSPLNDASSTAVTKTLSGLTAGTTYYYRIAKDNTNGYARSDQASFTTFSSLPDTGLCFDGIDDFVEVPYDADLNTATFTYEFWVRVDGGNGTFRSPLSTRHWNGGSDFYGVNFYANADSAWDYSWGGGIGAGQWHGITGPAIEIGQWTHLAATYDGTTMRFYVNGILQGDTALAYVPASSTPLYIGQNENGYYFNGVIDEVRIWNVARDSVQIRSDMHRVFTSQQSNLAAYWQLNEGTGTNTNNLIGGNQGTLNNFNFTGSSGWCASTIPAGGGTSASASSVTNGTAMLGTVSLTTTEDFDAAVDLTATEISVAPNALPSGSSTVLNDRYWVINTFGTPGTFSADLTFTVPSAFTNNGSATASNYTLYRRNSNSDGSWTSVATGAGITATTITFNGITSFSQFSLGTDDPLPVELTSFFAHHNGNAIELTWSTETELNNHGYEIEKRMNDGDGRMKNELGIMNWIKAGFVEGNGTTNAPKDYSYIDKAITSGTYSYRLKQIDRDGNFSYSQPVEVTVGSAPLKFELSQNYPNPFNPTTTIGFTLRETGFTTLKIYDVVGREVATLVNEVLEAGVYRHKQFSATHLSSGVYFAKLQNGNNVQLKRMMLLK